MIRYQDDKPYTRAILKGVKIYDNLGGQKAVELFGIALDETDLSNYATNGGYHAILYSDWMHKAFSSMVKAGGNHAAVCVVPMRADYNRSYYPDDFEKYEKELGIGK